MSTDTSSQAPDPEDMFSDTRMSFGDHIEDLRAHLIRAILGFVVGMVVSIWPLGPYVLRIIVSPVEDQLDSFEVRKVESDIRAAREKMKRDGISLAPRRELKLVDKREWQVLMGMQLKEQPVLDDTIAAIEKILVDLEIHGWLDDSFRNQGNFIDRKSVV